MKKTLITLFVTLFFAFSLAQQAVTVSGIVTLEGPVPENARVGIHTMDADNRMLEEVASTAVITGTFSVTAPGEPVETLFPFRSGAVPLLGLGTDYRVSPEGANFVRGVTRAYVDNDSSGDFTLEADTPLTSFVLVESGGFYILIYVDRDVTLTGQGTASNVTVQLAQGWNVFMTTAADGEIQYVATNRLDNAVLEVLSF